MALPRRGSLFWTLGGSFLLVLLLAVALQAVVAVLLVEPGLRRWQEGRAALLAANTAAAVEDALRTGGIDRVPSVLAAAEADVEPLRVFLRGPAGRWIGARPVPPGWQRRLEEARRRHESASTPDGVAEEPRPSSPSPGPGRGGGAGGPLEVLARHELEEPSGDEVVAAVYVVQARQRLRVLSVLPRQAAVFVPVGLVLAVVVSLVVTHRLQRRIARLDILAARIGQGELDARIEDPGSDELGHLGLRLNEMAANLERARSEVRGLERQRARLLADISHDLVTPLTSIRGFAETLLDGEVALDEEQRRRYLRTVLAGAERMDRLLGDLVELSRLEAGTLELRRESVDLGGLVLHSVERLRSDFERAGLALEAEVEDGLPPVDADGHRLEQVVDNLLSNALRHVPGGEGSGSDEGVPARADAPPRNHVRVRVSRIGPRLQLEVEDDGPGIAADDLPHVFDRFYRADRARSTPGSGLGLAIAREIVLRHGGEIRAANRGEGSGAVIRVELPVGSAPPGAD